MKIGPLIIEWAPLSERDRIALGLPPWPPGWEMLCIGIGNHGIALTARPRKREI